MRTPYSAALAALVCLGTAAPIASPVLHEKRDAPALDWVKGARVERDAILPMRIALTQTNLDKGHDYLMEVADPTSDRYGKYWTSEKVHDAFAPAEDAAITVKEWLASSGIDSSRVVEYENKGWLAFEASVEEAEALLHTVYHEHEHKHSEKVRVGSDGCV